MRDTKNPVAEIVLAGGAKVLFDAADMPLLGIYRWRALEDGWGNIYARATVRRDGKSKTLLMHRLVLGLDFGNPLEGYHRNGDTLDNRRENLRAASRYEIARARRRSVNKTGYKGVTVSGNRFMASCGDKATGYIGQFATAAEAGAAYDKAAREKYGQFAVTNEELRR